MAKREFAGTIEIKFKYNTNDRYYAMHEEEKPDDKKVEFDEGFVKDEIKKCLEAFLDITGLEVNIHIVE